MKSIQVGMGNHCPVCDTRMLRKKHPDGWTAKPKQPYYFRFWDCCNKCRRIQHYESAKIFINQEIWDEDEIRTLI
jgi:DNA-directed RNA polymerase subunit RPC12/RpoP